MKTNFTVGKKTWSPVLPFVVLIATLGLLVGNAQARINVVGGITPGNSGNINCNGNPQSNQNGYATIQAAVNASSNGDEIVICPGTYNEAVSFGWYQDGLVLRGSTGVRSDVVVTNSGTPFALSSGSVTLKNMTITSTNSTAINHSWTSTRSPYTFENLAISAKERGIDIEVSAKVTMTNLQVASTDSDAIYLRSQTDAEHVFDTLTLTAKKNGIYSDSGGAIFKDIVVSSIDSDAIKINPKFNASFTNITATSTNGGGLYMGWFHTGKNLTFQNINATSKNRGIYVEVASKVTINTATVTSSNDSAIYLAWGANGAHEFDNISATGQTTGLHVDRGGVRYKDLTLSGANSYALYVGPENNATFENITANSASGAGLHFAWANQASTLDFRNIRVVSSGRGIYIDKSAKTTFNSVTVNSSSNSAIYLASGASGAHEFNNLTLSALNFGLYTEHGGATFKDIEIASSDGNGMQMACEYDAAFENVKVSATNGSGINMNWPNYVKTLSFKNVDIAAKNRALFIDKSGAVTINGLKATSTNNTALYFGSGSNAAHNLRNMTLSAATTTNAMFIAQVPSATINNVCVEQAKTGIQLDWGARNVAISNAKLTADSYGVRTEAESSYKTIVGNSCFMKSSTPRAYSNSTTHRFDGNYWQGVAGGTSYSDGNVRDSSTLASCPVSSCAGGLPTMTIATPSAINEGNSSTTTLNFTVSLSAAATAGTTATYTLGNATATGGATCTAGVDYINTGGTVTINSGSTTGTIPVTICGDTVFETDETFTLTLSSPVNATLGSPSSATGKITDDDALLVAHYRMEDPSWNGTAGEWKDISGNNYHGTTGASTNAPRPTLQTASPAKPGDPGTCGYGYVPPQAGSGDGTAAFTTATLPVSTAAGAKTSVSFWMKWNGTSDVSFVRWDKYALYLRDGIFGFTTSNWSLDRYGTNSLPANQWVHVVAVFVNGDVQSSELYLNGVKKTLSAAPASSFSNADAYVTPTLKVAWQAYNDFWRYRGDIDEVKVFNGQLTQDQVTALYNETHVCPSVKLIADWRMDETAWNGTVGEVADSSGNNLNGQAKSGATLATTATAKLCQGGVFDNQNYVELPDSGSLQVTTSYTIAAWIKTSKGAATIVSKTGSSSPWLGYVFALGPNSGGKLSLWNGSGSWYTSSGAAVNDGAWHHVAATVNGNSLQFYVDGVSNGSAITLAAVTTASSSPLRVGFENSPDASTRYFSGQMDEVKIWSGALTATQIATGYANEAANKNWDGSARSCQAMLVADWRMDESGWNGTAGEIKDASASAYHGTATGATTATGKICRAGDLSATGTSDYLKYPYQALHGRDAFSVALWFKTAVSKSQQELLQGLGSSASDDQIEIYLVNGTQVVVNVRDTGNTTFTAPGSLTNNAWHHLAFTRAGASGCLYIDGALVECKTTYPTGALVINSNALLSGQEQDSYGGGFNTGQALEGHIDELKVWDGTLSAAQVTAGYANESAGKNWDGSARTCLSLSAHYKFDDTWGPGDTLDDSSGKNKPASLNGTVMQEAAPAVGIKPATCKAGNFNKAGWFSTASGLDIDTATNGKNSVSFWMYWDGGFSSTNFTMPFSWGGVYYDLAVSKYRSEMGNGVIGFNTGNGDVYGVTADGLANGWHHVAAVFNNGDVTQSKLYIDGVRKTLTSYNSQNNRSATTSAGIGAGAAWGDEYRWSGKLDNVKIYKGEIDSAQIAADKAETLSCAALDHIRIEAGTGLTCQREAVIFKACQDADSCATLYTGGDAQINLAPTGKWYAAASGGAALTDPQTIPTAGTLTLYLQQTTATTVDVNAVSAGGPAPSGTPTVTCNTDTTAAPCAIAFADKGLIFTADKTTGLETTIPPQISGTESGQLYVSAAKDDGDGQCVSAVSGGTATIGYTCIDPGTCSSGTDWLATAGTLTFDTNGYADFKFTYKDAGKIQLTATTTAGGVTLTGNSNSFVVKPAALCVYSTDIAACTKPAGSEHECSKVKKAGETFNLTVTAVRSGYDCASASTYATHNYKATGITLGSVTVAPDTDVETPGVTTLNITSGGSAAVDQSIKEVGVFKFSAKPPTPYIDGGVDIGGPFWTGNLGRFYPDHFTVTGTDGSFAGSCGTATPFTYTGQSMTYGTRPSLTITAMNGAATPLKTTNYRGNFQHLQASGITLTAPTADASQNGADGTTKTALSATINAGDLVNNNDGTLTYSLASSDAFTYTRNANALIAPYTSTIDLVVAAVSEPSGSDGVSATGSLPTLHPTGIPIRYGRARLTNAYGSELLDLGMDFRTEYYNGPGRWVLNAADTCTGNGAAGGAVSLAITQAGSTNITGQTCVRDSGNPGSSNAGCTAAGTAVKRYTEGVSPCGGAGQPICFAGNFNLWLQLPGSGNAGAVDVTASVPVWLQSNSLTARARFGSPKAPYIYMRERY